MASLVNGSLSIERESSVDFGRDLARDDLQDLLAKFHQESVKSGIDLLIDVAALEKAVLVAGHVAKMCQGNIRVSCHIPQQGQSAWRTRVSWRLQG